MSEVTVKSAAKIKDWTNKEGKVMPIYKVELSDGRFGESFQEVPAGTNGSELDIQEGQYGLKIKWNKLKNGFAKGGFGSKSTNESFSLSYSKDIVCAMIPKMEKMPTASDLSKVTTTIAETFYNWLESKKK